MSPISHCQLLLKKQQLLELMASLTITYVTQPVHLHDQKSQIGWMGNGVLTHYLNMVIFWQCYHNYPHPLLYIADDCLGSSHSAIVTIWDWLCKASHHLFFQQVGGRILLTSLNWAHANMRPLGSWALTQSSRIFVCNIADRALPREHALHAPAQLPAANWKLLFAACEQPITLVTWPKALPRLPEF